MSMKKIASNAINTLKHFNGVALFTAVVISAVSAIGYKYANIYTMARQPLPLYLDTVAWFVIWALIGYIVITLLFKAWENKHVVGDWKTNAHQFGALCLAGMMLSWIVWITLHYPGAMRDDTLPQLFQYFGYVPYYTQHPIFDTLIFGFFINQGLALGNQWLGLYIFLLVQALVTSVTFTYILLYLRERGVPRWLVVGGLIFYMFARVIYAPLNTMSKDAINGWSFALVCLYMVEIIRTRGSWLKKPRHSAAFIAVAFFCIASKRTMMYLIVPFMLLTGIVIFLRYSKKNAALTIAAGIIPTVLVLGVLSPVINIQLHPAQSITYEMYSIPVQQIVRTYKDHPDALTKEDVRELSQCFDIESAVKVYNPHRSDEANGCWVSGASKKPIYRTWVKLASKYPLSYIEAFESLSGAWMSLNTPIDYNNDLHVLDSEWQMNLWMNMLIDKDGAIEQFFPVPDAPSNLISRIANKLDRIQSRVLPISSYGLYSFAIPFSVFVYAIWKKNGALLLASLIWAILFVSFIVGPIALYWYTVPATFTAPLVLALPYIVGELPGHSGLRRAEVCRRKGSAPAEPVEIGAEALAGHAPEAGHERAEERVDGVDAVDGTA